MKKYSILLIAFFQLLLAPPSSGQMPGDKDYANWDWEDQRPENWQITREGRTWNILPPFLPVKPGGLNKRTEFMNAIQIAQDYTRSRGWILMGADFGIDNHYASFVLYNKYRSVIRFYYYIQSNISYTKAVATCTFDAVYPKPATLSSVVPFKVAPDKYKANPMGSTDMIVKVIRDGITPGHWQATDFPMMFDPNIQDTDSPFRGAYLAFKLYGVNVEKLNLKGRGASSPDPGELTKSEYFLAGDARQMDKTNSSGAGTLVSPDVALKVNQTGELSAHLREQIAKINDNDPQFLKDFKSSLQAVASVGLYSSSQATAGTGLKSSSQATAAATALDPGTIATAVTVALKVANFVVGLFEGPTTAVVNYQVLELTGTITVEQPIIKFGLKVPGVKKLDSDQNSYLFECPVGLINLKTTPTIQVTEPYSRFCFVKPRNPPLPDPFWWGIKNAALGYTGKYIKFKLDQDIQLATNQVPGMQLLDVKFAVLCKPRKYKDKNEVYKITDKYIAKEFATNGFYPEIENPVYNNLTNGRFIVHKYNPDEDPAKHEIYFGSPYLDKNHLKGITFEVPEYTDVYLGVYALFKVENIAEPVVFHAKYQFDRSAPVPVKNKKLCGNAEQPVFPLSDYYNFPTSIISLEKPSTFGTYKTESIVLKPGFSARGLKVPFLGTLLSFNAIGAPASKRLGNTIIDPVAYNCNSNLRLAALNKETHVPRPEVATLTLFPNPTPDFLFITSPEEVIRVQATDILGHAVPVTVKKSDNKTEVDCSRLKPGIYVLTISTPRGTQMKRIVKQ